MSKILANQIANYGDDAPIEIKEGLNIPAGKPIQAAGSAGTNGQVLTSTGASIQWTTPFNGDYNALANLPTIPAAQVASDWNATSGVSRILNKPVVPAQPSVVTNTAGIPSLTYNSGNGQFTYTPPDLSGYLTAGNDITLADNIKCVFGDGNDLKIWHNGFNSIINDEGTGDLYLGGNSSVIISNSALDEIKAKFITDGAVELYYDNEKKFETTTEGVTITGSVGNNNLSVYGDALVFGGLTAGGLTYPTSSGTLGQVLTSDGAGNVVWGASSGGGGIALTDLSVTTTAAGTAALTYNNLTGVFTYTPPNLSGYLTSYTETDPVFSISPAAGITSGKITNWDAAYAWGDHTNQGYLTAETQTLDDVLTLGSTTTQDIVTTGKIYYSNHFPLLTDLQAISASNWHGMFAHAHDTAHGYFAHASNWIQLLDIGSSIGELDDVDLSTPPSTGQVLKYNGANWAPANESGSGGGANVTISDTAPGSASTGDLWWESDRGRLKIYYQDVDSAQWVDASPPLAQPNVPVAAGFITLNGTSPTWTGTTGYTVSGTQPGGAGTDYVITLTFPTAYSARTDYIVQATYDGTDYIPQNGAEVGVARGTSSVVFTPRRLDSNPLSLGDIMVTITNL